MRLGLSRISRRPKGLSRLGIIERVSQSPDAIERCIVLFLRCDVSLIRNADGSWPRFFSRMQIKQVQNQNPDPKKNMRLMRN